MNKRKSQLDLRIPEGANVQKHEMGGDTNEVRFTIPDNGFQRLVAIQRHGYFTWILSRFRK